MGVIAVQLPTDAPAGLGDRADGIAAPDTIAAPARIAAASSWPAEGPSHKRWARLIAFDLEHWQPGPKLNNSRIEAPGSVWPPCRWMPGPCYQLGVAGSAIESRMPIPLRRSKPLRRSATPVRRSPWRRRLICSLGSPRATWRRSTASRRSNPERRSLMSARSAHLRRRRFDCEMLGGRYPLRLGPMHPSTSNRERFLQ